MAPHIFSKLRSLNVVASRTDCSSKCH